MLKWFQRGIILRLLSIVLAFFLWFIINEPTFPFSLSLDSTTVRGVQVEARYDTNKYQIVRMRKKVDVVLIGDKDSINRLPAYRVYVDLTNLSAGKHPAVPVQIEGLPAYVDAHPTPAIISVELAEKSVRDVSVHIATKGKLPNNYRLMPISYEPARVRIYGIKQEVNQVSSVSAPIFLSNLRQTTNRIVPLVVHSSTKHKPNVRVVPDQVKVTIPIEYIGLVVPLSVSILHPPPSGYQVDSITVHPAHVRLYGPTKELATFKTYPGVSLDLSQVTESTTMTKDVAIVTPVKKVTPTKVEIYVKMSRTPISR